MWSETFGLHCIMEEINGNTSKHFGRHTWGNVLRSHCYIQTACIFCLKSAHAIFEGQFYLQSSEQVQYMLRLRAAHTLICINFTINPKTLRRWSYFLSDITRAFCEDALQSAVTISDITGTTFVWIPTKLQSLPLCTNLLAAVEGACLTALWRGLTSA